MKIPVIRSQRKTVSLAITDEGPVIRAPLHMPQREIDAFVRKNRDWLDAHMEKAQARQAAAAKEGYLTQEDIEALAQKALAYIPKRVAYYAPLVGVSYGRITIRNQRTRWGSCSSKGNLNFNCLLMLTPPEVIDSVIVHELCHRKEMNHSARFYAEVLRVFPEYHKWNQWLKAHGDVLLARMQSAD